MGDYPRLGMLILIGGAMLIRVSRNMFLPGGVPVRAGDVVELTGDTALLILTYGWGAAVVEAPVVETATSHTAATRQKAARTGKAD